MDQPTTLSLLEQLDREQDELLERLDELNAQIEALIAEWSKSRAPTNESPLADAA